MTEKEHNAFKEKYNNWLGVIIKNGNDTFHFSTTLRSTESNILENGKRIMNEPELVIYKHIHTSKTVEIIEISSDEFLRLIAEIEK